MKRRNRNKTKIKVSSKAYERIRNQIANAITSVLEENNFSTGDLAKVMGISHTEITRRIWDRDILLSTLVRICESIGVEPYLILRPLWPATMGRKPK